MKKEELLLLLFVISPCCSALPPSSTPSPPSTTPHPEMEKLHQLQGMEESSLTGWYLMVNNFLRIIQPDHRTLDDAINFATGKHGLNPQEFVLKVAKMNLAFLCMLVVGSVYVIVMLVTALFFFFCRLCGRCGAKDSQKQRRSDNCWRTVHKFCLVLMVAFLVVPIACMCIINEHMAHSSPSVKGNITQVFDILGKFANQTDQDIDKATQQASENPIRDFDAFKSNFVELVQENISSSIDHKKLEDIKNIVSWIASVEEEHASNASFFELSSSLEHLKRSISSIRSEVRSIHNCSAVCDFRLLPLERIDLDEHYVHVHSEFEKLLKINFEELTSVIDQIQNNTILRNKIETESESLKRFANETMSGDKQGIEKIKRKVKYYTDKMRKFTESGKKEVQQVFAETDGYEIYRYWAMLGCAAAVLLPALLLTLGLGCGCSGHREGRHPTKRTPTSHCGGICLLLAVYYFFLTSSALMLVTICLFVVGGNAQTFVCVPLHEKGYATLDQMYERLAPFHNNSLLEGAKPSQVLNSCAAGKSIIYAIGLIDENDPTSFQKFLKNSEMMMGESEGEMELEERVRGALLEITSGIRGRLHQFANALDLRELRDIPRKLQELLTTSRNNVTEFMAHVASALEERAEDGSVLLVVNASAASVYDEMNALQDKLDNFSSSLLDIYNEADLYKAKIRDIERSLDEVEEKLPKVVKAQLFYAVASSTGWTTMVDDIGKCQPVWIAYNIARVAVCDFVVAPINGFWFGLGWALVVILPTILFSVKLSRYYLRMKYDDDAYIPDEAVPLEDMSSRSKPFSYTNPAAANWMPQFSPHQNYIVHPSSSSHTRQFHYK